MTALKGKHDMKNPTDKISDKEIQLYLMGELQGSKADFIRGIDLTSVDLISSEQDMLIKEQINRLRKVDKLLLDAAKHSYKMPSELEQKIKATLAMKALSQKKRQVSLFSWAQKKLQDFDLTSLVSGGALAALGMFVVVEIQPDLLLSPSQLTQSEVTFRGAETANKACNVQNSTRWQITESFAFSASLCEAGFQMVELQKVQKVSVGQKFVLHLVATKDVKISIEYLTKESATQDLIFEGFMRKGDTYKSDVFEFSLPVGRDQINISSSAGDKLSYQFEVK